MSVEEKTSETETEGGFCFARSRRSDVVVRERDGVSEEHCVIAWWGCFESLQHCKVAALASALEVDDQPRLSADVKWTGGCEHLVTACTVRGRCVCVVLCRLLETERA